MVNGNRIIPGPDVGSRDLAASGLLLFLGLVQGSFEPENWAKALHPKPGLTRGRAETLNGSDIRKAWPCPAKVRKPLCSYSERIEMSRRQSNGVCISNMAVILATMSPARSITSFRFVRAAAMI